MKRLFLVFLLLLFSTMILGCQEGEENNYDSTSFLEKANQFKSKIDTLTDSNVQGQVIEQSYQLLSEETTEDNEYTKDDFLDVYHNQPGLSVDINRTEFLIEYKDLLEEILLILEEEGIIELEAFINIQFETLGEVDIYCGFVNDDEIIIKLNYVLEERRIFSAIKMGIVEDQFILKDMSYYQEGDNINYRYNEFYENNSYFSLGFDDSSNYIYHYISEIDTYEVEVVRGNDTVEGESPQSGYNIRWNDLENDIRFLYSVSGEKELLSENIDYFNDYGIVFSYMDYDVSNDHLRVIWNLLEADGWDYVYFINGDEPFNNEALYKDDVNLFPNDNIRAYINENYVLLSLDKNILASQLTDEVLSLEAYGLSFLVEKMNIEYLNSTRESAYETVMNFDAFSGLNIYDENFTEDFLDWIDTDLSFLSDQQVDNIK